MYVTLNSVPATLLFDSGFNGSLLIRQEQADEASLRGAPMGTAEGFYGKSLLDTARLQTFRIDSMQFGAQPVWIGKFPLADGGIGAFFLSMHGAILDYSHDMLYLQAHPHSGAPADALQRSGDVVIPLKRVKGKKGNRAGYYVQALVSGTPMVFLIDTGWGGAGLNLDQERAAAFGMPDPAHGAFKLGKITIDTDFTLVDLSQVRKKEASVGMLQLDGVIGCSFLKEHGAIIDFAKSVMYLHP